MKNTIAIQIRSNLEALRTCGHYAQFSYISLIAFALLQSAGLYGITYGYLCGPP